jgi:hypothetical protein
MLLLLRCKRPTKGFTGFRCYENEVYESNLRDTIDFPVIVLDYSMVQFYYHGLLIPLHVAIAVIIILAAAILVLMKRKRQMPKAQK